MDPLPVVVAQLSKVVERTRHAMEQHWGARQGKGYNDDSEDRDNVQNEDDKNEDNKDKDRGDRDKDEDQDEEEAEDENKNNLPSSPVPGLSTWDLLGEAFKCGAAAIGLSSSKL